LSISMTISSAQDDMLNITFGYGLALLTACAVSVGDYLIKVAADGALPLWSRTFLSAVSA